MIPRYDLLVSQMQSPNCAEVFPVVIIYVVKEKERSVLKKLMMIRNLHTRQKRYYLRIGNFGKKISRIRS